MLIVSLCSDISQDVDSSQRLQLIDLFHVLQVAVKKMKRKFYFWEECINLREIKVCGFPLIWSHI